MATRGYITIKNKDDHKDPYIGNSDILVEAYHDGYTNEMIEDIMNIPIALAKLARQGMLGNSIQHTITYYSDRVNYNDMINKESALRLYMTWDAVADFLLLSEPLKYNRIEPGVTRYGFPVDHKSSSITISHDATNKLKDLLSISVSIYEDDKDYNSYLRESINSRVDKINKLISREQNKIQFDEESMVIKMSIQTIFFDVIEGLMEQKHTIEQQRDMLLDACMEILSDETVNVTSLKKIISKCI
jgi:hypothetical protein